MNTVKQTRLILTLISVGCVFIIVLFWTFLSIVRTPLVPKNKPAVIIEFGRAASASHIAQLLKQKNLIHSTRLFLFVVRAKGLAHQLKAGVYQIQPGESLGHFLDKVVSGDVITEKFNIIAGTTQYKVAIDLMKAPYLDYHLEDWSVVTKNHPNAEGLLLADTYQYRGGSSSKILLTQAHDNLLDYLTHAWEHREPGLPYKTPYQLLIAASILEKETAISEERKLISGIMVNRLKKGMPLQMDPTVIYGLGTKYRGKLSHSDLKIDSPYNSYRYRGLPPTPIAMIGREAIDAAAHPQLSKYLYFVAKGDGSHQFSETYEQQRKAIAQYQRKDS